MLHLYPGPSFRSMRLLLLNTPSSSPWRTTAKRTTECVEACPHCAGMGHSAVWEGRGIVPCGVGYSTMQGWGTAPWGVGHSTVGVGHSTMGVGHSTMQGVGHSTMGGYSTMKGVGHRTMGVGTAPCGVGHNIMGGAQHHGGWGTAPWGWGTAPWRWAQHHGGGAQHHGGWGTAPWGWAQHHGGWGTAPWGWGTAPWGMGYSTMQGVGHSCSCVSLSVCLCTEAYGQNAGGGVWPSLSQ